jgi:cytidylate kinase
MGIFSGISGGNAARDLRAQANALKVQQFREGEMYRLQTEATNAARLDLFEKDRLSQLAEQQALDQLNTPGATILLGETVGGDPDLARQRRAGFFAQSTSAAV